VYEHAGPDFVPPADLVHVTDGPVAEAQETTQAEMDRMGGYIEEATTAGWLVSTEGCLPSALGARVRQSGGTIGVTDGPFTEAKGVVGGEGECELRQLYEAPALAER
jgi:hypothetical protein